MVGKIMLIGFWRETQKERGPEEDHDVDGWIT
jgi:hypothetical protein